MIRVVPMGDLQRPKGECYRALSSGTPPRYSRCEGDECLDSSFEMIAESHQREATIPILDGCVLLTG